jgi:DNA-binding SARP family transcriptional activator
VLEFRVLGPLEVVGDEGPIRIAAPKQRATLAILLLHANRVVSVDRLADDLYAGAAPVTAVTQVQRQISELRKALGDPDVLETRAPGYVLHVTPDQLDLACFERLAEEGGAALARGEHGLAASLLPGALALWRGAPLADLAYEPFARTSIERLDEIRLAALEQRLEAELALGRHPGLVGELHELVAEYPLRERFRAQLMLALYRSGRQAEALETYRNGRELLVERFGLEPTPMLRELERAILAQDPWLEPRASAEAPRELLVVPSGEQHLDALLAIAQPLALSSRRALILARLASDEAELALAVATLNERRASLQVPARTAAFTTADPADDVVRLATAHDVELIVLDAPAAIDGERLPHELAPILERSPADVALLAGSPGDVSAGVFVPFGGSEHDWAALEIAAWLAASVGCALTLVGTRGDSRDASRLLADAALAVQRVVGVETEPKLADPNEDALLEAIDSAGVIVTGISARWRREGIGAMRRALVRRAQAATMLVHSGLRPNGLAPRETRTRFTWSIGI